MNSLTKQQERLNAIEKIIKNNRIEKQEVLKNMLERKFNISTNQGTISKDLKRLGIKWDKDSKCYSPNDELAQKYSQEQLWDLLIKSDCVFLVDSSYVQAIFKCEPIYAPQLAMTLESHFNSFGVATIAGSTGTVILFIPTTQKDMVLSELNQFFEISSE